MIQICCPLQPSDFIAFPGEFSPLPSFDFSTEEEEFDFTEGNDDLSLAVDSPPSPDEFCGFFPGTVCSEIDDCGYDGKCFYFYFNAKLRHYRYEYGN